MAKKDTASRMRKLVDEFSVSGQSRKAFAAAHGIKEGKLQYWISKLTASKKETSIAATLEKDFVPITLPGVAPLEGRNILIRLQSGVEIEIPL